MIVVLGIVETIVCNDSFTMKIMKLGTYTGQLRITAIREIFIYITMSRWPFADPASYGFEKISTDMISGIIGAADSRPVFGSRAALG